MLVDRAISVSTASVSQVATYTALEKTFASLTRILPVMLATGFIATNLKVFQLYSSNVITTKCN